MFTCEICGQVLQGAELMSNHVLEVHIHGEISCPFCDLAGISDKEMTTHIASLHLSPTSSTSSKEPSPTLDCPLCQFKHSDENILNQHINKDHFGEAFALPQEANSSQIRDSFDGQCPMCPRKDFISHLDLTAHVDNHLLEEKAVKDDSDYLLALKVKQEMEGEYQAFKKLKMEYGMIEAGNFQEQSQIQMERAVHEGEISVVDYHEKTVDLRKSQLTGLDDGNSVTFNILPALKKLCSVSNDSLNAYFCSVNVDHYGSSFGDKGWGCGYRNLQMLISSLQHQEETLFKLSNANFISKESPGLAPSIDNLQKGIEKAWSLGFDEKGGEQLGKRLYHTRKWIGATEIVAFLTANQIRTQIIDFHRPSGSDGTHPVLFEWVLKYFQDPTSVQSNFFKDKNGHPFVPPLYLQHQGHSRTIVGVEVLKKNKSIRLLILDPSHSRVQISKGFRGNDPKVLRLLRKNIYSIKSRQYQIVAVTGIYSSEQEAALHKVIASTRIS